MKSWTKQTSTRKNKLPRRSTRACAAARLPAQCLWPAEDRDGRRLLPTALADRTRWRLVDKLPELFALVEDRAQHARRQRDAAFQQQVAARRLELWEQAVPQARERYLEELNQIRAIEYATAWRTAGDPSRLRDGAAPVC
jgi:hypothetical protein